MTTKPVLVIHGIANHDQAEFEKRVSDLQNAIAADLPEVNLIPVYWGDLGGHSQNIRDCLPQLEDGRWTTRAESILSFGSISVEVRGEPELTNEQRAELIMEPVRSASPEEFVRAQNDAGATAVIEALDQTVNLRKIDDEECLKAIGYLVKEALAEQPALRDEGEFEVRTGPESFETRGWIKNRTQGIETKVKAVISAVDKVVGKIVQNRLGVLNQRLRASIMNGVAATLGDIVAYHSNKKQIQQRLWDAISQHSPGFGTRDKPIGLIAHSLGGVISFDAMMAPAIGVPLHVHSFVSFGSQPAFFQIIDPRIAGATYTAGCPIRLPDTLKQWFNLWNVVDLLAFTAGTVFRLNDGSKPEDIVVEDSISVMLDANLWLHSIYWTSAELRRALVDAFS